MDGLRRFIICILTVFSPLFSDAFESKSKLTVSIKCVSSQGYLRSTRHHLLNSVLTATRHENSIPLYEIAWELQDAMPGWVWLRSHHTHGFARAHAPPDRPPWLFSTADKVPHHAGLFRIEHINNGWFVFSNHTGGYINCLEGGLIRGHGYFPHNMEAAKREPTTEFEITPLNYSLVQQSFSHKLAKPYSMSQNIPDSTSSLSSSSSSSSSSSKCSSCRWAYDQKNGYPMPAFSGALSDFLCPSMFRDLSDYVWKWPFTHFKEKVVSISQETAAKCLSPIPIIYAHAGTQDAFYTWSQSSFRKPYILITGQSDWPVTRSNKVLKDPNLVKWYAQNCDLKHSKLVQIPIGLNCFEHAPEMHQTLLLLKAKAPIVRDKLVLVNFGNTHPSRTVVWEHFCGKNNKKNYVTCSAKAQQNNIRGNPHLVSYYKKVSSHKFVVAPRGNGWDTHRLWEALYLGCIPIVESSPLDPLYSQYPVLIVKNWKTIDEGYLNSQYKLLTSLDTVGLHSTPLLHRPHWKSLIETTRTNALNSLNQKVTNSSRFRCWG